MWGRMVSRMASCAPVADRRRAPQCALSGWQTDNRLRRCQVLCVNVGCPDVFFGPLPGILTGMTEPWIFSYPDRSALRAGPVKTGRRPPKGSLYGSGFSASLGKENLHGAAPGAAMGLPGAALPSKPLLQPFRPADRELAEGFPPPLHGVPLLRYIR